jgi:cytochrome P450
MVFPHAKQRFNPYPFYMNMRNLHPIEYDDNSHAWGVFRYKDIKNILDDHENFSSDLQKWQYPDHQEIQNKKNLITSDPPLHNQLYNQISSSFNSSIISELEYRVEQITKEILIHVIENGHMDLITDVAYPVPIRIIAELLGIPPEDHQLYKKWVNGLVREEGGTVINPISKVTVQIQQEMNSYLQKVIQKHREEKPHTEFISNMLRGWSYHSDDEEHEEAEREEIRRKRKKEHSLMSEERILSFCSQLLIAGYMTTTNLIGNVFLSLLENPQEFKQLQENRSLIPSAIEETLRYRSPIQSIFRFAVNDNINIGGRMISSGQKVILWLGSANRDETVFNNPDRFDIRRDTRAHLAFGSGIHFCTGAPLARLEARVILEVMLQQLQNVILNDNYDQKPLEPVDSLVFHGVKHLPLKFNLDEPLKMNLILYTTD